MSAREGLNATASVCAVIALVAGTATSTLYTGIVFASFFFGGILFEAVRLSINEMRAGKYVKTEAMRTLSLTQLYLLGGGVIALAVSILVVYGFNSQAWTASFGFSQLAALALIGGGGWVIVLEWIWYQGNRYKQCPDCARKVLAEARKCEHCHYRFALAILPGQETLT